MRSRIAAIAFAIAGLTLAGAGAAYALDDSQVAAAYADGYMGTDNQFHEWEHRSDAEEYRAKHADQYHPWRHDDPRHANGH